MSSIVKDFKDKLEVIFEGLDTDSVTYETQLLELEDQIFDATYTEDDRQKAKLMNLLELIKRIKKEYDFYDAEAEREYLFPNGEDEE